LLVMAISSVAFSNQRCAHKSFDRSANSGALIHETRMPGSMSPRPVDSSAPPLWVHVYVTLQIREGSDQIGFAGGEVAIHCSPHRVFRATC
jgi:hypothetical protein